MRKHLISAYPIKRQLDNYLFNLLRYYLSFFFVFVGQSLSPSTIRWLCQSVSELVSQRIYLQVGQSVI